MLAKNLSLLFHLKRPKTYVAGPMPVYLRITLDGNVVELCTSRKCEPKRWDRKAEGMSGKSEDAKEFNHHLNAFRLKVFEARLSLVEKGKDVTPGALKDLLTGKQETSKTVLQVFKQHNEQMAALVGNDFAAGTLERYETALRHVQSFIRLQYGAEDLDIRKLDFEFISEYEFWLKSVRKCGHNSAIKYIANFRKIINKCVRSGWLAKDPFLGYKMTKREVHREALTASELQALMHKELAIPRLSLVRDIFVFCCYTGLAYADVKKLKRSEIGIGVDGERWIFTSRQKTETPSRIPLLPTTLLLIKRYSDHPQCCQNGLLLPVLSNQKMNSYLKEIADVCGITKNFTCHIARHTFATTVTLSNGVPIETVARMLGHKNLRTTQHYAKILDGKVSDDMALLRRKLDGANPALPESAGARTATRIVSE